MWMAFVSGVSEAHIKDGRYAPGEEERVDRAIDLIEKSKMMFAIPLMTLSTKKATLVMELVFVL